MKILITILLATVLSGCASMINGTTQQVTVRASEPDAKIYANEELIGTGNGTIIFQKKKDYTLTARKEGCNDTSVIPQKSFDSTTLLGVLIDLGIISILVVDGAINGAWNKFDRTHFAIEMQCKEPAALYDIFDGSNLHLAFINPSQLQMQIN